MKLPKYSIIKHKAYRDVAFLVYKCFDAGYKLKIKGRWINQGFDNSWPMDHAKITILDKDVKDWLMCANPSAKCVRYEEWIPFK